MTTFYQKQDKKTGPEILRALLSLSQKLIGLFAGRFPALALFEGWFSTKTYSDTAAKSSPIKNISTSFLFTDTSIF